ESQSDGGSRCSNRVFPQKVRTHFSLRTIWPWGPGVPWSAKKELAAFASSNTSVCISLTVSGSFQPRHVGLPSFSVSLWVIYILTCPGVLTFAVDSSADPLCSRIELICRPHLKNVPVATSAVEVIMTRMGAWY